MHLLWLMWPPLNLPGVSKAFVSSEEEEEEDVTAVSAKARLISQQSQLSNQATVQTKKSSEDFHHQVPSNPHRVYSSMISFCYR